MTLRQHVQAAYYLTLRRVLRRGSLESYLLTKLQDMQGRVTIVPAWEGLNLPIDWRALNRARSDTIVYRMSALIVWTLLIQHDIATRLQVDATWWLPGSWVMAWFKKPGWWMEVPWALLLVWLFGFFAIDAVSRVIEAYRACDRSDLSTEHGSARIAFPEDLASAKPGDNLFPVGYDIYGGFDDAEYKRRRDDLELLVARQDVVNTRILRASVAELPLNARAIAGSSNDEAPVKPRSRVAAILSEVDET